MRQDTIAVLLQNAQADRFSGMNDGTIGDGSANRRSERDHRSDVFGTRSGNGPRNHSTQAVADQVDLAPSFFEREFDSLVHVPLDKQIRAIGIDADAGKICAVSDAAQPLVEFCEVKIGAEKTGDDDYA